MIRRGMPGRQRGMAALLIALLVLGGMLFVFSSRGVTTVRVERERSTNEALARAKDALIAYAASHGTRPGQLPCPDVNDDGIEDLAAACTNLIGRLPWVTLGLPDLRDDSGERLWYATSADFGNGNTVPLNSDTAYRSTHTSLSLTGTTAAANLVAIILSPGATLTRADGRAQVRGCGATCDPRDFLDIVGLEDNSYENRIFVSASRSSSFNDTLMPVFSDDIMRLVERRAARELAQRLRDHYDAWASPAAAGVTYAGFKGFYPWAAQFNNPTVASAGVNANPAGQLPMSAASVVWNNASAGLGACVGVNTAEIQCTSLIALPVLLTISGTVRNVGTAFIDPPDASNATLLGGLVIGAPSITWQLVPGAQTLNFTWSALVATTVTLRVRAPSASAWTTASWLAQNNWHENAGYALSTGYALNGAGSCGGFGPSCITLANTAAPTNDKHAVVLMSGRALSSAAQVTRPVSAPASPTQFFEGLNPDVAYTVLEANARTATFNDTAIAVRP